MISFNRLSFTGPLFGSALVGFSGAMFDPVCRQTIRTRLSHIPIASRILSLDHIETAAVKTESLSIVLVLDVSGSMAEKSSDGTLKLDVLKEATHTLFRTIERGLPEGVLAETAIRSGMTVYNDGYVSSLSVSMHDGWGDVLDRVDWLEADGHTYSAEAFKTGLEMMLKDKAASDRKILVFMSDGVNSDPNDSQKTQRICENAKKRGVTIYSIAFEAPEEGKSLLMNCASSDNGLFGSKHEKYYFDAHNDAEFKEAFRRIGEM